MQETGWEIPCEDHYLIVPQEEAFQADIGFGRLKPTRNSFDNYNEAINTARGLSLIYPQYLFDVAMVGGYMECDTNAFVETQYCVETVFLSGKEIQETE